MVLCEDSDCSVCFFPYSRMDRIPRVLHCRHTFCELCLEAMQQLRSGYLMVSCPLCRQVTCIDRGLSLQEALWVDSEQWEQIAEDKGAEAGEDEDSAQTGRRRTGDQAAPLITDGMRFFQVEEEEAPAAHFFQEV
ncbi:RING finger protein 186 [Oryzias melastigma]|uniref:RING finger protein 186 n=1 Tax=Oryzias melastigma TaxID=30732 RepID=A0A834F7X9_ORYME|nr:RING finger protein 186 [Oryzias melastigma]